MHANIHIVTSFAQNVPCAVRQSFSAMAKKKAAAPPEQFAGPSLIICRNK